MDDIFVAARQGDLEAVNAFIAQGADLAAKNEYGFTALHCAAMGSNGTDPAVNLSILKSLVEAGSELEEVGGGRTALYLLAEFSPSIESVQYLIDRGANPDVKSEHGTHVVVNAMMPEVQELLSRLTGVPIPVKPTPIPRVKMSKEAWKAAKADLDRVFEALRSKGLIARQNAGYTQSDGFSDCSEEFHRHPAKSSVLGFCFYTRQDLNRAKSSSVLPLAFWGAPDGQDPEMIVVGHLIVDAFEEAGMEIQWNGDAGTRPSLLLHRYSQPDAT